MLIDKSFQTFMSKIKNTNEWQFEILIILLKGYVKNF